MLCITTVEGNKGLFTCCQRQEAVQARKAYAMAGCPSPADFKAMVQMGLIKNCPVTLDHVRNANIIFGKDVGLLKGRMVCQMLEPVVSDYIEVPLELYNIHKDMTLAADVISVNKKHFLTSISKNIKFATSQKL
eukprot:14323619-Ditylum_brightwellii.AAC.1